MTLHLVGERRGSFKAALSLSFHLVYVRPFPPHFFFKANIEEETQSTARERRKGRSKRSFASSPLSSPSPLLTALLSLQGGGKSIWGVGGREGEEEKTAAATLSL